MGHPSLDHRYWRMRSRTLDEEKRAERGVERRLVGVALGAELVGANGSRVAHLFRENGNGSLSAPPRNCTMTSPATLDGFVVAHGSAAQFAYDQPTLGAGDGLLLALIVLARQRTARTELGKRQHPRFGGGLESGYCGAGGGIVLGRIDGVAVRGLPRLGYVSGVHLIRKGQRSCELLAQ